MGRKNYLIEGVSGAGKTSVAEELERRGYHVVHGDRVLAYVGDPETGERLDGPPHGVTDRVRWGHEHWIWPVDKVKAMIGDRGHPQTFCCGGSRNFGAFIDLFDAVFVLDVDLDTLSRRLAARPEDEFGGKPPERALILRLHATKEDIPKGGTTIDATAPVARVVDAILEKCG
ncbi:MAG: nucleoside kinase [Alphaproteobacteria bacterium]|nr:nucleoside kinase [Alphaproteobacteria bacterium]